VHSNRSFVVGPPQYTAGAVRNLLSEGFVRRQKLPEEYRKPTGPSLKNIPINNAYVESLLAISSSMMRDCTSCRSLVGIAAFDVKDSCSLLAINCQHSTPLHVSRPVLLPHCFAPSQSPRASASFCLLTQQSADQVR